MLHTETAVQPATDSGAAASIEEAGGSKVNIAIAPYVWLPSFAGSVTVKGVEIDTDATFIDILDNSDRVFGLMGAFDVEYKRFVFQVDGIWATAQFQDQRSVARNGELDGNMDTDVYWLSMFAGYRLIDHRLGDDPMSKRRLFLDGFVGGRATWFTVDTTLTAKLDITLPDGTMVERGASKSYSESDSWVEPFVGLRFGADLTEGWAVMLRGDIGGFGVDGSDFAWQALALFGYRWRFNDWNLALFAGFRALGQDYSSGDTAWNQIVYGPMFGLGFEF